MDRDPPTQFDPDAVLRDAQHCVRALAARLRADEQLLTRPSHAPLKPGTLAEGADLARAAANAAEALHAAIDAKPETT